MAIDLKSFYASVECVERGFNPMRTHLVVADNSRTEKTICLAVSPSLKSYGIPGRARLFEVIQKIKDINKKRALSIGKNILLGSSVDIKELERHPELAIDYIVAKPRMAHYIQYSAKIYNIYLRYVSPKDIHPYSIDEVFIDATNYLSAYKISAHELAMKIIQDVLKETGITATAGIGTNLFLCKVAMDIVAKHIPADKDGVRVAELDEKRYRELLWNHRPLTEFWRFGSGIVKRLSSYGLDTMGKIARCSIEHEELFYHLFGVNAEIIIDHAWGWEPCTMEMIKLYRPEERSVVNGQVLQEAYTFSKARVVVQEMIDALSLDLLEKHCFTNQLVLSVGYDKDSLNDRDDYLGLITFDYYGRKVPKSTKGTSNLMTFSSSSRIITAAILSLYDHLVDRKLLVRRISISANNLITEEQFYKVQRIPVELDLFFLADPEKVDRKETRRNSVQDRSMQETILRIKHKFGKNSLLRGLNFREGSTAKERNQQIGGHRA